MRCRAAVTCRLLKRDGRILLAMWRLGMTISSALYLCSYNSFPLPHLPLPPPSNARLSGFSISWSCFVSLFCFLFLCFPFYVSWAQSIRVPCLQHKLNSSNVTVTDSEQGLLIQHEIRLIESWYLGHGIRFHTVFKLFSGAFNLISVFYSKHNSLRCPMWRERGIIPNRSYIYLLVYMFKTNLYIWATLGKSL